MELYSRAKEAMSADVVPCTPPFETLPGALVVSPVTLAGHPLPDVVVDAAGPRVTTLPDPVAAASRAATPGTERCLLFWMTRSFDCVEALLLPAGASLCEPDDAVEPFARTPVDEVAAPAPAWTADEPTTVRDGAGTFDPPTKAKVEPAGKSGAPEAAPVTPTGNAIAMVTAKTVAKKTDCFNTFVPPYNVAPSPTEPVLTATLCLLVRQNNPRGGQNSEVSPRIGGVSFRLGRPFGGQNPLVSCSARRTPIARVNIRGQIMARCDFRQQDAQRATFVSIQGTYDVILVGRAQLSHLRHDVLTGFG
jgi:hypothetical protein